MNSASDVWQAVLKLLEQHLSPTAISTWFSDCQVVELLDNRLILHTPSEFSQNIIMTRYLDLVKDALKEIFAADFDVQVIGDEELARRINRQPPLRQEFLGGDQFTFDKFVNFDSFFFIEIDVFTSNTKFIDNALMFFF